MSKEAAIVTAIDQVPQWMEQGILEKGLEFNTMPGSGTATEFQVVVTEFKDVVTEFKDVVTEFQDVATEFQSVTT
ncbi:hypothetical protein BGX31_009231 [Mortierella sp. GBA43]|nr:hypothetical protein BGX31_009231 [Mortierella sp. GBA43]